MKRILFLLFISLNSLSLTMQEALKLDNEFLEKLINDDSFLNVVKGKYNDDQTTRIKNALLQKYGTELSKIVKNGFESFMCAGIIEPRIRYTDKTWSNKRLIFSPDKKYIIAHLRGSTQDMVEIWDMRFSNENTSFNNKKWYNNIFGFGEPNKGVTAVAMSPCNKRLAYSYIDPGATNIETLRILDITDVNECHVLYWAYVRSTIKKLAIIKEGRYVVTCDDTGIVIYDIIGDKSQTFGDIRSFGISKCQNFMIVAYDQSLEIWDITKYPNIKQKKIIECNDASLKNINFIEISDDGKNFAIANNSDLTIWAIKDFAKFDFREIEQVDRENNRKIVSIPIEQPINSATLTNKYIVLRYGDKTSIVYFANESKIHARNYVTNVDISEDGANLICYDKENFNISDLPKFSAFTKLSLFQLILLIKIARENGPENLLKYANDVKLYYNDRFQLYIERYFRYKLLKIYYGQFVAPQQAPFLNIIGEYLDVETPQDYQQKCDG